MINDSVAQPPSYAELHARYGTPLGVEEARAGWGTIVKAARSGETILVTRERWEWAALVPLSQVSGILSGLPLVPLSTARAKLGDLVRQVTQPYDESPVLLGRHRTPVAALISARDLINRAAPPSRTDAEAMLLDGHAVTLTCDPDAPAGPVFSAVAVDREGGVVAAGSGADLREALRALTPTRD
ncbi:type II toxin-antitoxin system prevent-host-death family antitoxin [Nonomuraea sp. NPDC052116]|uniref:type II toxin-antitoxin system prevent-host-death family antitoxin n=1 Tax=Nonomuraea sp. NPDC052116 TaxID=3155665 RepID=UPI003428F851